MFIRKAIYLLALTYAGFANVPSQAVGPEATKAKNVLFLISDDLRPELGCYGNDVIISPNIDRLAQRGMVFNRAYCQQSVCSPSRSSVMTGVRPDTNQVWNLTTHFRDAMPDVITLPQCFKNQGFATQGLGKIYHGSLYDPPSWSIERKAIPKNKKKRKKNAFQSIASNGNRLVVQNPSTAVSQVDGDVDLDDVDEDSIPLTKTDRGGAFRMTDDPPNGGGEGELADAAIDALKELGKKNEPFFLGVGFHKPHLPFNVPKHYWDLYDPDEIPVATNQFLPVGAPDFALVEKNEMWNYSGVPDTADLPEEYEKQLKHGYYAAVSYMDAQLGRILDKLDDLGLTKDTIIILWGDHGWKLGEHNRWCKHSNFEDDARAPLIVSVPGMKQAGQSTDALVEFVDIYPTLVELAGLSMPSHLEGMSFAKLLDEPSQAWKTAAFSQYPRTVKGKRLMGYSMRTNRFRLTRWVAKDDHSDVVAVELYDHQNDPQENLNVASNPEYKSVLEDLTEQWTAGWQNAKPTF